MCCTWWHCTRSGVWVCMSQITDHPYQQNEGQRRWAITIDLICERVTLRSVVLTQKHINIILARCTMGSRKCSWINALLSSTTEVEKLWVLLSFHMDTIALMLFLEATHKVYGDQLKSLYTTQFVAVCACIWPTHMPLRVRLTSWQNNRRMEPLMELMARAKEASMH